MEDLIKAINHDCVGFEWLVRSNGQYGYYAHIYKYWAFADRPRPPRSSYYANAGSPIVALQDAYNKWLNDHLERTSHVKRE